MLQMSYITVHRVLESNPGLTTDSSNPCVYFSNCQIHHFTVCLQDLGHTASNQLHRRASNEPCLYCIGKNWLCSTMLDDWLSSLMITASEKDILLTVELNDVVNCLAEHSDSLRRHMIYT